MKAWTVVLVVCLMVGVAYAQKAKIGYISITEENLRSSPNGKKIGTVLHGTQLERIGQQGKWTKVRIEGWIWTPSITEKKPVPESFVTIDGYDSASETIVREINLWRDYQDRSMGVSVTARHGEKVKLIRRAGDGILVETKSGKQGWVMYYFIKEFK